VSTLPNTIWRWLEQVDQALFLGINKGLSNSFFDFLLPLWRTAEFWMPLYLFLLLFLWMNFKQKAGWWVLYFILTVSLMDMAGNHLIKQTVQRIRPCNDPQLFGEMILRLPHCGTGYSFISNHAANHFAMASFLFFTLGPLMGKWKWTLFVWAFSVGFAQIYVGVHYPADITAGSLLGLLAGWLTSSHFNKHHHFPIFDKETTIHS